MTSFQGRLGLIDIDLFKSSCANFEALQPFVLDAIFYITIFYLE